MKFRYGFVSNSSSTSYVVYIPKNFKITENDITEKFRKQLSLWSIYIKEDPDLISDNSNIEIVSLEKVNRVINDLRNNRIEYNHMESNEMTLNARIAIAIAESFNIVFETIEISSGDTESYIISIDIEKLKDLMKKHGDVF